MLNFIEETAISKIEQRKPGAPSPAFSASCLGIRFCFVFLMLCTVSCGTGYKLGKNDTVDATFTIMQQLGLARVTEVKFKKIDGSMTTVARMYTDHGPWHDAVKVEGYIPTFIWKDVKLLSDKDMRFHVYTSGIETVDEYYSSIMIVDENNVDALASDSPFRQDLIRLFENRLKDIKSEAFYRAFWKFEDPKRYRELYN